MKKKKSSYAIYCKQSQGPTFGGGHDICVYDNCKSNGGYTHSYISYECNNNSFFGDPSGNNQNYDFRVSDYEVFTYN